MIVIPFTVLLKLIFKSAVVIEATIGGGVSFEQDTIIVIAIIIKLIFVIFICIFVIFWQ
jgi:hypothetical protein